MTMQLTSETVVAYSLEGVTDVRQPEEMPLLNPLDELTGRLEQLAPLEQWRSISQEADVKSHLSGSTKHLMLDGFLKRTPDLNQLFQEAQTALSGDQYFAFQVVTAENIKAEMLEKYSGSFFKFYYFFHFIGRRVLPKLNGFRKICRLLGVTADMSKAEVMGRLIYSGLKIVETRETPSTTIFITQRHPTSNPSLFVAPSGEGFLFSMIRKGKNEKPITIYKFRSMHPFAEFVQAYLHEMNGLAACGKFKNDFRVSTGGKLIRKYWIDELPMLYNLLKGDIKLVGVRPISEQYLSLYPEKLRIYRSGFKPGLLPPFYSDLPESFDEILKSELTYLKAYEKAPLRTDISYFVRIVKNIFMHHARSC